MKDHQIILSVRVVRTRKIPKQRRERKRWRQGSRADKWRKKFLERIPSQGRDVDLRYCTLRCVSKSRGPEKILEIVYSYPIVRHTDVAISCEVGNVGLGWTPLNFDPLPCEDTLGRGIWRWGLSSWCIEFLPGQVLIKHVVASIKNMFLEVLYLR